MILGELQSIIFGEQTQRLYGTSWPAWQPWTWLSLLQVCSEGEGAADFCFWALAVWFGLSIISLVMDSPLLCDSGVSLSSERSGGMPYLKLGAAVAKILFMLILGPGLVTYPWSPPNWTVTHSCTEGALENHMEASIGPECSSMDIWRYMSLCPCNTAALQADRLPIAIQVGDCL